MKNYTQSPLPFQGQKRKFLNHVKQVLTNSSEDATYVDLFGGSGILSHTVKQLKPNAKVVYNDYDDFSKRLAKYVTNYNDLTKQTFYNNVRQSNYVTDDYLAGVEIVHQDYKELFDQYKDLDNVVFLVDPPYLSTDTSTYTNDKYWKLKDYLNVLDVLVNTNYLYFTSNKSQIVELCQWMEDRTSIAEVNPFSGSTTVCINTTLNHSAKYTDMMLYKLN